MSYMVKKNNPDIYISAIWAIKKRPVSGYRGSVLWLYPCQWLSEICLMVVPLVVPKQTMNDRSFM